jgi:hypothetical protein
LWVITGAAPALAQPKPPAKAAAGKLLTEPQKKAAAKKAYKDAEAKFKDGNFKDALDSYKVADDILPIPATKYKIAVCRDKLGQILDAAAAYQAFLDSSPNPDKMGDAIGDANTRLAAIKKTPGKLRVAVTPSTAPKLAFTIDGGPPQPAASLPVENVGATPEVQLPYKVIVMSPGHHKLGVSAEGFDPGATEFDLPFADTKDLTVALNATPVAAAPPAPVADATPPPPPPPPPPAPRSNVPAYVTIALAGAGVVVGTTFGVLALQAKNTFNKTPTAPNADTTDRNALISDMSFAVALTFGVTGVVLLLSNDSPEPAKAAAAKKTKTGVRGFVTPYAGPNGGGAVGVLRF